MHGRCVSPDTCHCEPGWGGPDCSSGESWIFEGRMAPLALAQKGLGCVRAELFVLDCCCLG